MIRTLALIGVIAGSGVIGRLGMSAAEERKERLNQLTRDGERLCGLLTEQSMTLPAALRSMTKFSAYGEDYRMIADAVARENEDLFAELRKRNGFSQLTDKELRYFADFLQKCGESISGQEIRRAWMCFRQDMEQAVEAMENGELKRAKVLQKVWLLAGMCAAVVLI